MLFKKKNKDIINVMHYQGLEGFNQDYPCLIEIKDDKFVIKRIKPELVVTLSINQIIKIDSLKDNEFMQKYNNTVGTNNKKYYLVITYMSKDNQEKEIIFWGTASEAIKFDDLKFKFSGNTENYSL